MNRNKVKRLASGATNPITGEIIDMPELRMAVLGADGYGPRVILREGGTMETSMWIKGCVQTVTVISG